VGHPEYNYFPTVTAKNAKLVIYADDTSFVFTKPSPIEFANKINNVFANVNEWFRSNLLFLNFNKTTYVQFQTKNSHKPDSNIAFFSNQITNIQAQNFLV